MAATIVTTTFPLKKGSPPDFGTLYSGRALEFDGVADYIDCGVTSNFTTAAGARTVCCWVKLSDDTPSNDYFFCLGNSTNGFALGISSSNYLTFFDTGTNDTTVTEASMVGVWKHLAVTHDGTTTAKIYVNGVLSLTNTTSTLATDQDANTIIGARNTAASGTTAANYMNCKMANFQIWNSALSLAEVQYSYTHPEKLAYNTSGSSLTASNLVAWYPMIEGEGGSSLPLRSPQMYITDGSAKELGSEINTVANATSTTNEDGATTGWTNAGFATFESTGDSNYNGLYSLHLVANSHGDNAKEEFTVVTGTTYKVSYSYRVLGGATAQVRGGSTSESTSYFSQNISGAEWSHSTYYFTATGTTFHLSLFEITDTVEFYFDNLSVKEVKMGNHGVTTFYGDELIASDAADNRTFDNDAGNWAAWDTSGGATTAVFESNKLKITTTDVDDVNGAQLPIIHVGDGSSTSIVVGRTYRITANIDYISGYATSTPPMSIQLGNATSSNFNINSNDDSSLYDNAIGSTNFSAPGANRLKISLFINFTLFFKFT